MTKQEEAKEAVDSKLDEALEESFPASDSPAVTIFVEAKGRAASDMAMDEISEFMSGDHDRIDALLDRFREDGGVSLDEFASALTMHMEWEEQLLFPAFARKVGTESGPSIDTMRTQHEGFRRQFEEIRQCPIGDVVLRRNLVEVLVESLADHNFAEEHYVYPWIDGALNPVEKTAILTTMKMDQGGHCHDAQNVA